MDEKFLFGIALGMIGGAVIVANSVKARKAVTDGQEQVLTKVNQMTKNSKKKSK